MQRALIVFTAGGAGCVARYLVGLALGRREFPYATLIVNLVGSLLIALVLEFALQKRAMSTHVQLALTTGFMGGFTTYSSFNYETTKLVLDGHTARGVLNICVTVVGCVLAGLVGLWLARRIAA